LTHASERAAAIIQETLADGRNYLGEGEGSEVLACYGITTLPMKLARTREEAREFAGQIGPNVALKIVSPQIIHKSDAGGVELNLTNGEAVMAAFDRILERARQYAPSAGIEGVLVEKMADPGQEVIVGMSRYRRYGPLVMFGLGGIFVEVFKDVVFGLAPIGRNDARQMIQGIRGLTILKGYRGKSPSDLDALERVLVGVSSMVVNHPEIHELDINPLIVHEKGKGATAADCRIILKAGGSNAI